MDSVLGSRRLSGSHSSMELQTSEKASDVRASSACQEFSLDLTTSSAALPAQSLRYLTEEPSRQNGDAAEESDAADKSEMKRSNVCQLQSSRNYETLDLRGNTPERRHFGMSSGPRRCNRVSSLFDGALSPRYRRQSYSPYLVGAGVSELNGDHRETDHITPLWSAESTDRNLLMPPLLSVESQHGSGSCRREPSHATVMATVKDRLLKRIDSKDDIRKEDQWLVPPLSGLNGETIAASRSHHTAVQSLMSPYPPSHHPVPYFADIPRYYPPLSYPPGIHPAVIYNQLALHQLHALHHQIQVRSQLAARGLSSGFRSSPPSSGAAELAASASRDRSSLLSVECDTITSERSFRWEIQTL